MSKLTNKEFMLLIAAQFNISNTQARRLLNILISNVRTIRAVEKRIEEDKLNE